MCEYYGLPDIAVLARAVGELTAEQTGGTAEAQAHTEAVQTAQTAALKKHSRMDLDAELDELLGGL